MWVEKAEKEQAKLDSVRKQRQAKVRGHGRHYKFVVMSMSYLLTYGICFTCCTTTRTIAVTNIVFVYGFECRSTIHINFLHRTCLFFFYQTLHPHLLCYLLYGSASYSWNQKFKFPKNCQGHCLCHSAYYRQSLFLRYSMVPQYIITSALLSLFLHHINLSQSCVVAH